MALLGVFVMRVLAVEPRQDKDSAKDTTRLQEQEATRMPTWRSAGRQQAKKMV